MSKILAIYKSVHVPLTPVATVVERLICIKDISDIELEKLDTAANRKGRRVKLVSNVDDYMDVLNIIYDLR
jgi:hypothetical protein